MAKTGEIRNLMNKSTSDRVSSKIGVNPNHDSQGTFGSPQILDSKTHASIGNMKIKYFLINGKKVMITATNRDEVLKMIDDAIK